MDENQKPGGHIYLNIPFPYGGSASLGAIYLLVFQPAHLMVMRSWSPPVKFTALTLSRRECGDLSGLFKSGDFFIGSSHQALTKLLLFWLAFNGWWRLTGTKFHSWTSLKSSIPKVTISKVQGLNWNSGKEIAQYKGSKWKGMHGWPAWDFALYLWVWAAWDPSLALLIY